MELRAGLEIPGVTLGRVLGRGATAVVYLGTQERFGRNVAVKLLEMPQGSELAGRLFRAECRTLGRLASHPNILTLFDAGFTDDGRPYLVSEYLPAGSIADQVRREGPLDWPVALDVAVQLAGALETTHLHDVAHGDLKPHNVLVGRMGQPVLADFGIARLMSVSHSTALSVLTPLFAAPELFEGVDPNPATDVYGLGSTLFALLDGESTMGSPTDSPLVVVRRVAAGERRSLDPSRAPADMVALIERCLATDPSLRPSTAEEVGLELQRIQSEHRLAVTPLPVMAELPEDAIDLTDAGNGSSIEFTLLPVTARPRRRPIGLRWVAAAAAALFVAIGALAWRIGGDDELPVRASTTTTEVPVNKGGIQPGIEYKVPGVTDSSAEMAAKLIEERTIFGTLDGPVLANSPLYRANFTTVPASFRFRAYSSKSSEQCSSLFTRQLVLRGLWERGGQWDGARLQVSVAQFANGGQAHEMFTAASIGIGVVAPECFGMGRTGIDDKASFGVVHREVKMATELPTNSRYNTWRVAAPTVAGVTYAQSTRMLMEEGEFLIDVFLLSDARLDHPDEEVMANIANEIRIRL